MPDDSLDLHTQRLVELGKVTENSAVMEDVLRDAFCSLVGSKFAATVAGGQSGIWLIDQCKALADAHYELSDQHRRAIRDALSKCKAANEHRNELVHAVKTGNDALTGSVYTIRSRRNTHVPVVTPWTLDQIHQAAMALLRAAGLLFTAMENAVDLEMMLISDDLAWEDQEHTKETRNE